ncbi:hypothetical protein GGH96_000241 [Coemansia sp. RSA 1972]|nr:hypothetical protein GGH96_000241 [Coemansia sp. RSA 1972]
MGVQKHLLAQQPATPPPSPPASTNGILSASDYNGRLDEIRRTEYPQLKTVFLDHTGSTVCAASHIQSFATELMTQIPANPHSRHVESQWTQARIDHARDRLLAFAGTSAERYAVVFTANATAAIRLAAEITPIEQHGEFCYTRESHTSVVGVRSLAADQGVHVRPIEFADIGEVTAPARSRGTSLLAYPAQCNFSGQRFPLNVADTVSKHYGSTTDTHVLWWVLVDAAAYAASSPLRLDAHGAGPDFVAMSMYKIFGAPTGLGALLIRRSSVPFLRTKRYFGGGTVAGLTFDQPWQVYRSDIEARMEDGTVNFHDIISLHHALDAHAKIYGSIDIVARHARAVTDYAVSRLRVLQHQNGKLVCEVYGHTGESVFGPTVAFNVKDRAGKYIGYMEVERLAVMAGISLRAGRFCNPGAAQKWLCLSAQELMKHASLGYVCGDDHDLVDEKPVGALRVSFGAMTSIEDIDQLVKFLLYQFRDYNMSGSAISRLPIDTMEISPSLSVNAQVDKVIIYPVKSCHGWTVPPGTSWPVTHHGLKYDRVFVLMREHSSLPMQQRQVPNMALIRPRVDIDKSTLVLEAPGHESLEISLRPDALRLETTETQVCSTRVQAVRVRSDRISSWLSSVLSVSCYLACEPRLLESGANSPHNSCYPDKSFANKAQILMVTQESSRQVEQWIAEDSAPGDTASRIRVGPMQYRPNIIVRSLGTGMIRPFEELQWTSVRVDGSTFAVTGPCRRCQMISIDQESAKKLKEPYATLARRMRVDGKVVFGIYLNATGSLLSTTSFKSGAPINAAM